VSFEHQHLYILLQEEIEIIFLAMVVAEEKDIFSDDFVMC